MISYLTMLLQSHTLNYVNRLHWYYT